MTAVMTATNQRENMQARNKTPVTSVTLLTEMLRVLKDPAAPAGLDRMYYEMTALMPPDYLITPAPITPVDGDDTVNLSQLHIDEVIPPATRWSVDMRNGNFQDLLGELAKPEPRIQRWLSHEIHGASLEIQNGQAVAV